MPRVLGTTVAMALMTLAGAGRLVVAQTVPAAAARIQVVDTAGRAVPNADVSVLEGLTRVIAHGVTDSAGVRTLVVPAVGEFQVVVRRLGYLRGSLFFATTSSITALRIQLIPTATTLPTIIVTAEADVRRRAYHIDADDIAASDRPILDGLDVLTKLRPDMIKSRAPSIAISGVTVEPCTIQSIWVNGQRVSFVAPNDRLALEKAHRTQAMLPAHSVTGNLPSGAQVTGAAMVSGIATVPVQVLTVLSSIRPEHIEEINYADCSDFSVERAHARNAVFVVLKRGVKFEPGLGSYVDDAGLVIAGNRPRIIGVFDEQTGQPLRDVVVVDSATGASIKTSETGTTSLAFLLDGPHTLLVRRKDYAEQRITILISAEDMLPITLMLIPARKD